MRKLATSLFPYLPLNRDVSVIILLHKLYLILSRTLLFLICFVLFGMIGLSIYISWALARPEVAPLQSNPLKSVNLSYENVEFMSSDSSHSLQGWYIPAAPPSTKTIIFSHGYGGNREEIWVPIYELARKAHELGYHVLMFDYGYVYVEERLMTGGVNESSELLGAVNFARDRGADHVVIWGFSMGAGTALMAAMQTDLIDGLILDSTFIPSPDTLHYNLQQMLALYFPPEPLNTLLRWVYPLMNGAGFHDIPYRQLLQTTFQLPIFFIHGSADERSPYEMIRSIGINQISTAHSQYWLVPGATHELVYRAKKDEYLERTTQFLQQIGL